MPYDPASIEPRWQRYWEEHGTFRTVEDCSKPKFYVLDMFPYPSGAGLHVGHPEGYTATDIMARFKRMQGFNVLHPMGWDAFGLPAERAAAREGIHPALITKQNTQNFRRQIKRLGFSYDWSREIDTSSPEYYRWTQWIFLRLHEQGLAYQALVPVNWCPALGTVLANEEVSPEGTYKETGDPVEQREMKQWMLKITAYAQRLLDDLDDLDWPEPVKKMQREWIGRSEGAEVRFQVAGREESFLVFTTRPDTLFGATYCVLAPEHPLVAKITTPEQEAKVQSYIRQAARKKERERMAALKEKTGVFTGAMAMNPMTGMPIPIWIADYVLASYGTGAIMAVPAHDQRDMDFARTFNLPLVKVVARTGANSEEPLQEAFSAPGIAVNSGPYNGLCTAACQERITRDLEQRGLGQAKVRYALRDWLFSRQRYWGEPFPLITLDDGRIVPLPDDALPLELPRIDAYLPTSEGEPPLARAREWCQTRDPATGAPATREVNTMPQWAGSCWYYLRFVDPHNQEAPWDPEKERYWMPVDLYIGGMEHAVLHLLYARFWHKVLFDLGLVSTKEPFKKLFNQGMILAWSYQDARGRYYHPQEVEERDGRFWSKKEGVELQSQVEKMSKSRLNVVNPDQVVDRFGADSLRLYEMFIGPLQSSAPWQTRGIEGVRRFLSRAWRLFFQGEEDRLHPAIQDVTPSIQEERLLHRTIATVGEDIENLHFNTAISRLMELVNHLTALDRRPRSVMEAFIKLLAPFAPHFAEEVWMRLGHGESIALEAWPAFDPALLKREQVTIPIQINGKLRGRLEIPAGADQATVRRLALEIPAVVRHLDGRPPKKVIYVPDRMLNLVVG